MAERKWGAIASGATFEALATTIVYFEDPTAALFGRRGKDGGQDARSGDGTRVFQAKHHQNGSSARAIADAKGEAAKISAYRQQGHARYDQWKGVTHWQLVTNAPFNPTDRQTWEDEVVPLFAAQGLTAVYWERANLDALLDKHREIDRSFFENETRALLSVPEIKERLPAQEPFIQRAELGGFFGREAELGEVREFLSSKNLFLVVHGAGGMGKTRLLVEAGEAIASGGAWQVLWANVASMAATGAWFEAIAPERPTLLLVDEPPDEALLRQLAEQLGGRVGRASQWKVLVAVRSPKDPVLRFLFGQRMKQRVSELAIGSLQDSAAQDMCANLLGAGALAKQSEEKLRDAARELSRRFDRHPVWLTLAVHLLEERGDLSMVPATAKGLADSYLDEVIAGQKDSPPEKVRDLLRWVALIGTVNRSEDSTVKVIGDAIATGDVVEVRRKLASLVARRVLIERGANSRFVELKPDVLRDHVLLSWLSVDVGFGNQAIVPSEDAKALVATVRDAVLAGGLSGLGRAILVALARTEFLLKLSGQDVALLDEFFESLRTPIGLMSASHRLALAEVLEAIGPFRPTATARVVGAMRVSVAPDETIDGIFGALDLGQNDVLLALAWPLFHAAMGAQTPAAQESVLGELCALAEAEGELTPLLKRGLPNDGKRAAALVKRVLEGGPQFWGCFDDTAQKLGEGVLTYLSRQAPTLGKRVLLEALVQPAIAVERTQTWSDGNAFHIQTFAIGPDHPGWATRNALVARIKEVLTDAAAPVVSRVALWHVLAKAHSNINQACRRGDPKHQQYFEALLGDLLWAHEVLQCRVGQMAELFAARELWDWHNRYETDLQLKEASAKLEALYAANDLATEFEHLLNPGDWKQREPRVIVKAAELAAAQSPDDIVAFLDRGVVFLGGENHLYRIMDVAWALGTHAPTRDAVRTFVKTILGRPVVGARGDFGATASASWIALVRKSDRPELTHTLVTELLDSCGSDNQRANLLLRIYGQVPWSPNVGELTLGEHNLLRSQKMLLLQVGRSAEFIAATVQTLDHDWPALRSLLEDIVQSLPPDELPAALQALVDGMYWAVHEADSASLPTGLGTWLLDQLLLIPDFDALGANVEWHIEAILKVLGRVPLSWLPGALAARSQLEMKQDRKTGIRALSYHARFSKYVRRIIAADVGDTTITEAVDALLDFIGDNGSVGYHLPEVLRDVDPEGLVIPAAVAQRLSRNSVAENVRRLARIGGAYAVGSPPWRTIAKAALSVSPPGPDERRPILGVLAERGVRSWSGKPGEVPAVFVSAVQAAKAARDSESDADLRPFWEWRLNQAETELRDQEERAKEERGE